MLVGALFSSVSNSERTTAFPSCIQKTPKDFPDGSDTLNRRPEATSHSSAEVL